MGMGGVLLRGLAVWFAWFWVRAWPDHRRERFRVCALWCTGVDGRSLAMGRASSSESGLEIVSLFDHRIFRLGEGFELSLVRLLEIRHLGGVLLFQRFDVLDTRTLHVEPLGEVLGPFGQAKSVGVLFELCLRR